jgi:nitrate reductase NapE component
MKDEDETEDMIFSFVFVAVTILTVLFVVGGIGITIWSLI